MTTNIQPTCEDLIDQVIQSELAEITEQGFFNHCDNKNPYCSLPECILHVHALCVDYVEDDVDEGIPEGYIRYQTAYGGPTYEFRIFGPERVEFWLLNWWDGAYRDVTKEPIIKGLTYVLSKIYENLQQ